ncbi:MAG: DUF1214 domain-containing protein, partial [Aestuariivirgaceae bacterium]|nr:DUF1214 domain-containing protein [Aestuariivirgaceae bacterium]
MSTGIRIAATLLVSGSLGLGSAMYFYGSGSAEANGPWRIWISRVMPNQSPYALAHYALRGEVAPDTNQMIVFTAATDSDGAALNAACAYAVSGSMPPSRWWSLAVAGDDAAALSSGHVITGPDGAFSAQASRMATPGNWLRLNPDQDKFELVLRFHGPAGLLK